LAERPIGNYHPSVVAREGTMTGEVTLYIDVRSPYSYLAKAEALALERGFDVRLDWLPFAIDIQGAYGGEVEERSERDWRKVRYL
jgi:2-hydroxychromene-2-carboxylate isomerase